MKINTKKTEVMHADRNKENLVIIVEDQPLKQVNNFTYLGVNINEENAQQMELNKRINKYNANTSMLYPLLKDKNVPRRCKVIIYSSILKPVLMYGFQSWSLTTKTKSKLQAAEMRVLRVIEGVTRRDRIRNTVIREKLNVTSLLGDVERGKLRWSEYGKRMNNDRHARKYMEWRPDGSKPPGRPKKRWIDGVKDTLKKLGTSLEEVEDANICQDRSKWRRVVRITFS
jgi:hypothetical protein